MWTVEGGEWTMGQEAEMGTGGRVEWSWGKCGQRLDGGGEHVTMLACAVLSYYLELLESC